MALAWAALLPPSLNTSSSSSLIPTRPKSHMLWKIITSKTSKSSRGANLLITNATQDSDSDSDNEKDSDSPAFNPFGFVTDNPSSRSAIQLPEVPAEDGNVGEMLYVS